MNIINLTEYEYNYLTKLELTRHKEKGSQCIDTTEINKDSRVYVYPTCTFKKLVMRKYIKSLGGKQVFKVEDANVLIIPDNNFIADRETYQYGKIELSKGYLVEHGDHILQNGNTWKVNEENHLFKLDRYKDFIFYRDFPESINSSRWKYDTQLTKLTKDLELTYQCEVSNSEITEKHIKQLVRDDVDFINDLDMQQAIYEFEVAENLRISTEDYNWQAIYDLLINEESYMIAIEIIKKLNVEPIIDKLIGLYLINKTGDQCKRFLYNEVFKRKPDLFNALPYWTSWRLRSDGYISQTLTDLKTKGIKIDHNELKEIGLYVTESVAMNGNIVIQAVRKD